MHSVRALSLYVVLFASALSTAVGCGGPASDGITLANTEPTRKNADWCDARAVIQDKCVRCHSAPPHNGAPFSLSTYADTQHPSPTSAEPDRTRAQRMQHAVETGSMPYMGFILEPPVEDLSCEERETLLDWLREGAKAPAAGDENCADASPRVLECPSAGAGGEGG